MWDQQGSLRIRAGFYISTREVLHAETYALQSDVCVSVSIVTTPATDRSLISHSSDRSEFIENAHEPNQMLMFYQRLTSSKSPPLTAHTRSTACTPRVLLHTKTERHCGASPARDGGDQINHPRTGLFTVMSPPLSLC